MDCRAGGDGGGYRKGPDDDTLSWGVDQPADDVRGILARLELLNGTGHAPIDFLLSRALWSGQDDHAYCEQMVRYMRKAGAETVTHCWHIAQLFTRPGQFGRYLGPDMTAAQKKLDYELFRPTEPKTEPKAKGRKARRSVNALALVQSMTVDNSPWAKALRLNRFTEAIEVCEPFPPRPHGPSGKFRPIQDPRDLVEAMLWFQAKPGFETTNKNTVWDALFAIASRNAYHPVRDYLDSLKWDGMTRIGQLFQGYFSADIPKEAGREQDRVVAYLEQISTCWMVSAVARVREPGVKVDTVPTVVGPQGSGKSRTIAALCGVPAWFMDDLSTDLASKDTKDALRGKWIVELGEFPHVKKEIDKVKQFFSSPTDRYRRSYDRVTQDWPRQCVFIATTNDLEFIDPTGSRRFWPIEISKKIDTAHIMEDRDQLWAEADHVYQQGYQWWLKPNIEAIAAEQQDKFQEDDIWTAELRSWIDGRVLHEPFTVAEAMVGALGFPEPKAISKPDQMRAAACLRTLKYRKRKARRGSSKPLVLWFPQSPHDDEPEDQQ
jgi:predicted P-loop ATPase